MPKQEDDSDNQKINLRSILICALALVAIYLAFRYFESGQKMEIPYPQLVKTIKEKPGVFNKISIIEGSSITVVGSYIDLDQSRDADQRPTLTFSSVVPSASYQDFLRLLDEKKVIYSVAGVSGGLGWIYWIFPVLMWLWIYRSVRRGMMGTGDRSAGGGGGFFSFLQSKAKLHSNNNKLETFADVAGVDEAKNELQEIVAFLKDPLRFSRLGGRIPRGILLMGRPGTGKTLLARAVAGEAGVPFFSMSGSDFIELFVGVGASRVRDLFEKAEKHAPCLVFIDEIDSIGKHRSALAVGGHDEHGQTLNQLLSQMDGFKPNNGVIIIAATNRPDVLDPALLRPGRFDRRVYVPMPDLKGRLAILNVHSKKIKLDPEVDLDAIARGTIGFSGADLANLINEAAIKAAGDSKDCVKEQDLEEAKEKVLAGPERKTARLNEENRKVIAFHEAGHAVVARALTDADPLHKVSIIPRGLAAGLTWQLPKEDQAVETKARLKARLTVLMAGRAAEEIGIGEKTISTGAENDFERATAIARNMICRWAMGKLGPRAFGEKDEFDFLGIDTLRRNYSESTASEIDGEINRILKEQMEKAQKILSDNLGVLKALAAKLLEVETIDRSGLEEFFSANPIRLENGAANQ